MRGRVGVGVQGGCENSKKKKFFWGGDGVRGEGVSVRGRVGVGVQGGCERN